MAKPGPGIGGDTPGKRVNISHRGRVFVHAFLSRFGRLICSGRASRRRLAGYYNLLHDIIIYNTASSSTDATVRRQLPIDFGRIQIRFFASQRRRRAAVTIVSGMSWSGPESPGLTGEKP